MTASLEDDKGPHGVRIDRRTVLRSSLAAAGATAIASGGHYTVASAGVQAPTVASDPLKVSPRSYRMKKSINLWAFPYPKRMTLPECLQLAKDAGFDGIELNYDLENDLSPRSSADQYRTIRKTAESIGIAISGLCSFLYWPYSLTDNDTSPRNRAFGIGPAHDRCRTRAGYRQPADDRRLDLHSMDSRSRSGAHRRLRPPRA